MSESFEFDIAPIQVGYKIGGKEYLLREASEGATAQFNNTRFACAKWTEKGELSHVQGAANLPPLLVSLCLFDKETNKTVPESTIRSWPSRVVQKLFLKAKEISEIDKEDNLETLLEQKKKLEEQIKILQESKDDESLPKNEQSGTTTG